MPIHYAAMPIDPKRWVLITVVALTFQAGARAEELSPPEIYRRVVASTLALRVTTLSGERYVGAAFVAFQPDRALTAWHLIRDADKITGTFSDGAPAEVQEVLARDELHDVALLRIGASGRKPLPVNLEVPPIASRLYAFGSPRGYAFSISDGLLSQVQTIDGFPQYQLTCPFSPGNSGGPVVNDAGEVVGLSAWSKIGAQNLNFAIPSRFLAALALPQSAAMPAPAPAPEILADRAAQGARVTEKLAAAPSAVAPLDSGLEQLQKLLASLAGSEVRITVSSAAGTQSFLCKVPANTPGAPVEAAHPDAPTIVASSPSP